MRALFICNDLKCIECNNYLQCSSHWPPTKFIHVKNNRVKYSRDLRYIRVIILNKEISNVDNLYLKLKSKYGPLVGYKFYQRFDDFYSSQCKKKLQ